MMKKVGIVTLFTGFNYGSSLQAFATKTVLGDLGYAGELLGLPGSVVKGRDVRLKKLLVMVSRTIFRPALFRKTFLVHSGNLKQRRNPPSVGAFFQFEQQQLQVKRMPWSKLKAFARQPDTVAVVCGSDQIWGAENAYVDPLNYLRFVPREKRVAYAPSFGAAGVPSYNRGKIRRYLKDIPHLSVREQAGADIVADLLGQPCPVLLDPTLLLPRERWEQFAGAGAQKSYLLLYFLGQPTDIAVAYIKALCNAYQGEVLAIPYPHSKLSDIPNLRYVEGGPREFVRLIRDAQYVCTDSFHGAAFSVNLNRPFYVFQRDYGANANQSSRVTGFLNALGLSDRMVQSDETKVSIQPVAFSHANKRLAQERQKSISYLKQTLHKLEC